MRLRYLLMIGGLGALVLVALLRRKRQEAPLPYQRSGQQSAAAPAVSKYDEYDEVLTGKKGKLQQQTQPRPGGMQRLVQPAAPQRKPVRPAPPDFFCVQAPQADDSDPAEPAPLFLAARIYQKHKLKDGDGVVVQLQEGDAAQRLLPGTLLYGAAQFAKNRLLIRFSVAEYQGERWTVSCAGYDKDFLAGLVCDGLEEEEHVLEESGHRLANKAFRKSGEELIQDLGKEAGVVLKKMRQKKSALLEDGRLVYVKVQVEKHKKK